MRRFRSELEKKDSMDSTKKMKKNTEFDMKVDGVDCFLKEKIAFYLKYLKNLHNVSEPISSLKQGVLEVSNFSTITMEMLFRLITFENRIEKERSDEFIGIELDGLQNLFPYYNFTMNELGSSKVIKLSFDDNSAQALVSQENGKTISSKSWKNFCGNVSVQYNSDLSSDQKEYVNDESLLYLILKYGTSCILPNNNLTINEDILESLRLDTENPYSSFVAGEVHSGRNCGKGFSQGQPIYRCQECGMDDTCVLCFRCFNPQDHKGHHVMVHTTDDNTSGICDCGDDDAWKNKLNCNADINKNIFEDPLFLKNRDYFVKQEAFYKEIISVFLDYFIEVFKKNTILSPYIEKTKEYQDELNSYDYIQENNMLNYRSDNFSHPNIESDYFVVLFNDEYHTFSHVQRVLFDINGRDFGQTEIPSLIDEVGYSIVTGPTSFEDCAEIYELLQEEKFSCKILTWENIVQINTAAGIIKWIYACLSIHNPFFQDSFRKVLSICLLETSETSITENFASSERFVEKTSKVFTLKDSAKTFSIARNESNVFKDSFDISLDTMLDYNIPYTGTDSIKPEFELQLNKNAKCEKSRLQNIFLLDFRYWKELRHEVSQIYLPILATEDKHKQIITNQYAEIFPKLIDFVGYLDREPQLTLMKECATQLFSNKSIVNYLASSGLFPKLIWSSVKIFKDFSHLDVECTLFRRPQIFNATKGFHVAFKQSLYALETVFGNVSDSRLIFKHEIIFPLLTLFQLFNGAYKMKRKTGEHVLREDQFFITYVEYSMSLYTIINSLTHLLSKNTPQKEVFASVKMILEFFKKTPELPLELNNDIAIIKFSISKNRVGYMNPVNTLIGSLLSFLPFEKVKAIFKEYDFLQISELSLRTLVLSSQTSCGFWVRNGHSAAHQLQFYREQLKTSAFSIDIALNQFALIYQPQRALLNIFYKWQFFSKETSSFFYSKEVYQEKTNTMISDLVKYLFLFITQRSSLVKRDAPEELEMKNFEQLIVYSLVSGPEKYSHISELVEDHPLHSTLDNVLERIADFSAPKGLNDEGMFTLKKSFYTKIDLIHLLIFNVDLHSLLEMIDKKVDSNINDSSKLKFVIEPKIIPYHKLEDHVPLLSSFAETAEFSEFIIQLLTVATEYPSSGFTMQLLHLIHAVLIDNQLYYKDNYYLPDSLNYNSIYVNLFKLAFVTDVNKYIKAKAIHLMKMFMKVNGEVISKHIKTLSFIENIDQKLEELSGRRQSVLEGKEAFLIKKKLLVKKRQSSLMAKFKKNQDKFLKSADITKDGESEMLYDEDEVICSSCQESSNDKLFMIPCYMDNTPSLRPFNLNSPLKDNWEPSEYSKDGYYLPIAPTFIGSDYGYDNALISCNHPIHYNCLLNYKSQFGDDAINFPCAVCQSLSNFFIPMFENDKPSDYGTRINVFEKKLLPAKGNPSKSYTPLYFEVVADMLRHFKGPRDGSMPFLEFQTFQFGNVMYALSNLLANSIAMLETSSRISDEPYLEFLSFNGRQFKTLKSVCEALSYYVEKHEKTPFNQFASRNGFNSNRAFQYVVDRYFLSEDSLEVTLAFATKQIFKKSIFIAGSKIEYCLSHEKKINVSEILTLKNSSKNINWINKLQKDHLSQTSASKTLFMSDVFIDAKGKSINFPSLPKEEKLLIITNLCYTLTVAQIKILLRKVCIFVKVVNHFNKSNADDCDLINGNRVNDGTDPETFRGDDKLYCDFLLSKLSNKKYTNLDNFMIDSHFKCSHKNINTLDFRNGSTADIKNYSIYNKMNDCEIDKCYYVEFYFQFLQGEDTGLIKLINLKPVLNDYILDQSGTKFNSLTSDYSKNNLLMNSLNSSICLSCGGKCFDANDVFKLSDNDYPFTGERRHMVMKCKSGQTYQNSSFSVFFQPNSNTIRLAFIKPRYSLLYPDDIYMQETNGPYLNNHGEGWRQALGSGTTVALLNSERYDVWSQKWLNLEIPGYLSRTSGSQLVEMLTSDTLKYSGKKMFIPQEILKGDIKDMDLAYTDIECVGIMINSLLSTEFRQLMFYDILRNSNIAMYFNGYESLPEGYEKKNDNLNMKSRSWNEPYCQARVAHAKIYSNPKIDNGLKVTQDRYDLWGILNKTNLIPPEYNGSSLNRMLINIPQMNIDVSSADSILTAEEEYDI
ncbi:hypothetical protein QEN19_002618 [Hanseniaspora menglaensis]